MSLVSIIIPCYNAQLWIQEAVDSSLMQTYRQVEIIVVDDGSSDESLAILKAYGDRIRLDSRPNRGGSAARNRGFSLSRGEYVMFLDADDKIAPDTLESLVAALEGQTESVAACPWWWLEERDDCWVPIRSPLSDLGPAEMDCVSAWLRGWYIPPCAILWPREIYERTGGWDETLTADQDGDLMLRALLDGISITKSEGGAAYYRKHRMPGSSVSSDFVSRTAFRSRMKVLEKVTARLRGLGRLEQYAVPVGQAYHGLARAGFASQPDLVRECAARAERLAGSNAISGTRLHRFLCRAVGLERKERLAMFFASIGVARRERKKSMELHRLWTRR